MPVSEAITDNDIRSGEIFKPQWLVAHGQPKNHKLWKLSPSRGFRRFMIRITPAAASLYGMNSSTWTKYLIVLYVFNEAMQYGYLDRELGERLWNDGRESMPIRSR